MRLVDLLLSPRHHSYGVSTKESHYRYTYDANHSKSKDSGGLESNQRHLGPYKTQRPSLNQTTTEKPSRSASALSYLLSKKSPAPLGYWNHSHMTSASSPVTGEISRLVQHPRSTPMSRGYVKQESGDAVSFTSRGFDVCPEYHLPFTTMDRTLNGNIWKREEFSMKSFSSSSSASSQSSVGAEEMAFSRRRVSLPSSDGSEMEMEQICPFMGDSDGYESLSSPLEAMEAARWMERASDPAAGYLLDWHNGGEEGGERIGYDIDSCPLFNFNFFGNALDDSPFEAFDDKGSITSYDISSLCDSPMVTIVPDVMTTEAVKNCGSFSNNSAALYSSMDHLCRLNEQDVNQGNFRLPLSNDSKVRHRMGSSGDSDGVIVLSGSAPAVVMAPATCDPSRQSTHQSEVVKLLLQNRHQWTVPPEKVSLPVGFRGSRKRTPATTGRAKVQRQAKLGQVPSNEDIPRSFATSGGDRKSFSASDVNNQDEVYRSSSLERLITELMLFESTKSHLEADLLSRVGLDAKNTSTVEPFASYIRPVDVFDELVTCKTPDVELFSSLELDSIYLSDSEPLCTLQEALELENTKKVEVFVKTEPEKTMSPNFSSPSPSLCQLNGTDPTNKLSHGDNCLVTDRQMPVQESALRAKQLFHCIGCDSRLESKGAVSDHDYCQNLDMLTSSDLLGLTYEQNHQENRRKYTETCFSRKCDYSTLKSLLLDSNLTEEVRKEAELDRAKSRKKMSEKLKVTSVNAPLRLRRLGKVRDDKILMQQLDEISQYINFSRTPQPEVMTENCGSDSGVDTLVTSEMELLSGNDDALFFDSFEDFYCKNQDGDLNVSNENSENEDSMMSNFCSVTSFESKVTHKKRNQSIIRRILNRSSVNRSVRQLTFRKCHLRRMPLERANRRLIRTTIDHSASPRRKKLLTKSNEETSTCEVIADLLGLGI